MSWKKTHLAHQKICMLVVGKNANTLSTLHGFKNWFKDGTTRKTVSFNWYQRLACCSVIHNYFWSSLRNFFTAFLETKTQLWKVMWANSGSCIGSSGSTLHPSLKTINCLLEMAQSTITWSFVPFKNPKSWTFKI